MLFVVLSLYILDIVETNSHALPILFFSRQKQTLRSKYEIVFPHFLTQSTEAKTLHEKNNLVFKLLLTTALYCLILHHKFIKNVRIILHAI